MAEMGPGLFSWSVQSGPELTQFGEYIKILGILGSQGTSLGFQLLGLRTSTAWGTGSIPGRRTRIPHAAWCSQKKKKKITEEGTKPACGAELLRGGGDNLAQWVLVRLGRPEGRKGNFR